MGKQRKKKTPTRGRPREFDAAVNLKVTTAWLKLVERAADKSGLDRADFIRRATEAAARRRLKTAIPTVNSLFVGNPYQRFGGYDCAPYGYRHVADPERATELGKPVFRLVEDEKEQKGIKRIVALKTAGMALSPIGRMLAKEGFKSRTGGQLTPSVLQRVINRAEAELEL